MARTCECCSPSKSLSASPGLVRLGWAYQVRTREERPYLVYTLDQIEYVTEEEAWERSAEMVRKAFRSVKILEG